MSVYLHLVYINCSRGGFHLLCDCQPDEVHFTSCWLIDNNVNNCWFQLLKHEDLMLSLFYNIRKFGFYTTSCTKKSNFDSLRLIWLHNSYSQSVFLLSKLSRNPLPPTRFVMRKRSHLISDQQTHQPAITKPKQTQICFKRGSFGFREWILMNILSASELFLSLTTNGVWNISCFSHLVELIIWWSMLHKVHIQCCVS